MLRFAIGRWQSLGKRGKIAYLLIVAIYAVACSQLQSPNQNASVLSLTPTGPAVSTTTVAQAQIQSVQQGYVLPSWTQVELPLGCGFHSVSPNLQWVLYGGCRSELSSDLTDWIAEIGKQGQLINPRQLRLVGGYNNVIGFTHDDTRLIVKQDAKFWLIDPRDLAWQSYVTDTVGVSGINSLGTESWSPDGSRYLTFGRLGVGEIVIAYPNRGIEETVLSNLSRQGGQFNWCANGNEIIYVEGDIVDGMKAQVFDLQSRKSRALIDSQFSLSITGASCSPDGKWLAVREQNTATDETTLSLIDRASGTRSQLTYKLTDGPDVFDGWQDLIWSPDGSRLALRGSISKTSDGFIVIEIPTGRIVFQGSEGRGMRPLAWSTNSRSLLVIYSRFIKPSTYLTRFLEWVSVQP